MSSSCVFSGLIPTAGCRAGRVTLQKGNAEWTHRLWAEASRVQTVCPTQPHEAACGVGASGLRAPAAAHPGPPTPWSFPLRSFPAGVRPSPHQPKPPSAFSVLTLHPGPAPAAMSVRSPGPHKPADSESGSQGRAEPWPLREPLRGARAAGAGPHFREPGCFLLLGYSSLPTLSFHLYTHLWRRA